MYGVELFFFISGALIVSLYGLGGPMSLASLGYWPKRLARILPLWILFFIIFTALRNYTGPGADVQVFLNQHSGASGWLFLATLVATFTAWLSPYLWNAAVPGGWSIQAEMAHYLAFATLRRFNAKSILLVLVGMNLATLAAIRFESSLPQWLEKPIDGWVRLGFYSTFFYFLLGVVAYSIMSKLRKGENLSDIGKSLSSFEWILSIIYVSTVLALPLPLGFGNNAQAIGIVLLSLGIGFVIQRVRLVVPALTTLGKYSYFIYFMHLLVLSGLSDLLLRIDKAKVPILNSATFVFLVYLLVLLSIALPSAWLSYRFFERPILQLARRRKSHSASQL
jgi:peptidoglycan/LPS O-acetylase OafA/YrhL